VKNNHSPPFTDYSTADYVRVDTEPPSAAVLQILETLSKLRTERPDASAPKPAKPPWNFDNLD
jgi:hypothetical protein